MVNNLVLFCIFLFYTLMMYKLINVLRYKRFIAKRLDSDENNIKEKIQSSFVIKQKSKKSWILSLQKTLFQCGLEIDVYKFLKNYIIISITILVLTYLITKSIVISFVILIFIPIITIIALSYLKQKRLKTLTVQLLEMVNFISSSLRAGYSLMQSLNAVTEKSPDPVSSEFKQVIAEINIGKTYEEAFNNLMERNPTEEIDLISTAIILNKEIGGNLTYILDTVSETLIERQRLKGEIKSLTAQGRLSGIILTLLPIGVLAILCIINPDYIKPLFQNTLGRIILGMGLGSQIIGTIFIKKIIKIDG